MAATDSSTFQDILLELMVSNETAEKIEKNTKSLIPLLTAPDAAEGEETNRWRRTSEFYASIEKSSQEMVAGLSFLTSQNDEIISVLRKQLSVVERSANLGVQIRNSLLGMAAATELGQLKAEEDRREVKKNRTEDLLEEIIKILNRKPKLTAESPLTPKPSGGGSTVGAIAAGGLLGAGLLSGFIESFRKSINDSFSGKFFEQLRESLKSARGRLAMALESTKNWARNVVDSLDDFYDRTKSRTNAILRKTGLDAKIQSIATAVEESFEAFSKRLKITFAPMIEGAQEIRKGLTEGMDNLLKPLREFAGEVSRSEFGVKMRAAGRLTLDKLGQLAEEMNAVGRTMAEGPGEIRSGLSEGFAALKKNALGIGRSMSELGTEVKSTWLEGFTEIKTGIIDGLSNLKKAFSESALGKWLGELGTLFRELGTQLSDLGSTFKNLFPEDGIIKKIYNFFAKPIKAFFDTFVELGPKLMGIGETLGNILGKIALPLNIVMGIWDFVKGFTEEEGDLTAKFKAGMTELVNGLVGWLVDIPKWLISKIAGLLGFEEFSAELDKMNFKDDILKPFMKWGEDLFASFFEWIGTMTSSIVKAILPKRVATFLGISQEPDAPAAAGPKASVSSPATADASKSLAAIVSPQSSITSANTVGAEMMITQADTAQLQAQAATPVTVLQGGATSTNVNNANVNSVTVNNSNIPERTILSMRASPYGL